MKKMMMILAMMLAIATSASAMTYAEARHEALFLTDKMAYELNLTDYQYEMVYDINLDYLRYIDRASIFGNPWALRNRRLADVLTATQYRLYEMANYFYRPVSWSGSAIRFSVYTRYADRNHFYRPAMRHTLSRRTGNMPAARPANRPSTPMVTTPRTGNTPRTGAVNRNANNNRPQSGVGNNGQMDRRGSSGTRTQPSTRGGNTNNANRSGNFGGQRK